MLEKFRDEGMIKEEHIDRIPSAGLWEGQTDEKELGFSYNEMQPIIETMLENYSENEKQVLDIILSKGFDSKVATFVVKRHFANRHKHLAPKVLDINI